MLISDCFLQIGLGNTTLMDKTRLLYSTSLSFVDCKQTSKNEESETIRNLQRE